MSKSAWIIAAVVALLAAIIVYNKVLHPAYAVPSANAGRSRALQVNAIVARPRDLDNAILASGTLLASEAVDLHAQGSGLITGLYINEGSRVAKGALLIKLFDEDLQAQLKKLQAQRESAERTEQRLKQLLAVNGIGQQDYDNALTQFKAVLADIDNVKAQIEKTEIRAPFGGIIGLRSVSPGAYITPASPIASLQQIDPLKIDFSVPEKYAAGIGRDDPVLFTVAGFSETFTARVFAIEPHIDEDTRTIKVRALVHNAGAKLMPGAFANMQITLKKIDSAIMVPTQCVIPDIRSKKVVVARGGKAEFRTVQTGVRGESLIQITDGIKAGDTVVTSALLFVKPKMDLKIVVTPDSASAGRKPRP